MKKIFSIVLLFVFLFNVIGCYLLYFGMRYHSSAKMASRLDEERYSKDETITIKIPFTLPYQNDDKPFERVHGEFEYNGEFYKLIKQKVQDGMLHVVCIKDKKQKNLSNFIADVAKMSTDLPVSSSTLKLMSSLTKDYVPGSPMLMAFDFCCILNHKFLDPDFTLLSRSLKITTPPPEQHA